jgi:hypothetical protein
MEIQPGALLTEKFNNKTSVGQWKSEKLTWLSSFVPSASFFFSLKKTLLLFGSSSFPLLSFYWFVLSSFPYRQGQPSPKLN